MDITKKHNTEIYKDEQQTSPKNITQKYINEQHGHHQKT